MNPPFGAPANESKEYIREKYYAAQHDLSATFIERMFQLCRRESLIGVLSNRTIYSLSRLKEFRQSIIEENAIIVAGDLGSGVLDAMVEASATVMQKGLSCESIARFIRATGNENKAQILMKGTSSDGGLDAFDVNVKNFLASPIVEFCYWVPDGIQSVRANSPKLEDFGIEVRQGIATGDNFRFLRLLWEVPPKHLYKNWHPYSKGGEYSPYVYNMHLAVAWGEKWQKFFNGNTTVFSCLVTRNAERYLDRPGLTYPTRTASRFGPRIMPAGMIFDTKGSAIFHPEVTSVNSETGPLLTLCAVLNSKLCQVLIDTYVGGADLASSYGEGMIARLPLDLEKLTVDLKSSDISTTLGRIAKLGSHIEPSQFFISPWIDTSKSLDNSYRDFCEYQKSVADEYRQLENAIEATVRSALELSEVDCQFIDREIHKYGGGTPDCLLIPDRSAWFQSLVSYLIGCAFGRWNLSSVDQADGLPSNLFDPLPARPPGEMAGESHTRVDVLASDAAENGNLIAAIERAMKLLWGQQSDAIMTEMVRGLHASSLSQYIETSFFEFHFSSYSKSRRKAPIYWPLSTISGSYTLWLYYPSLTNQTLYSAVNDFVEPKLKQVSRNAATLRDKGAARSRDDEKTFEGLQTLELELIELRDTLLSIAPTYRPNHDDGVQITAAPLWQLFRHKPWQKILNDTWAKLEKGDYDWAHLAMAYWPDRVREKCKTDKSLAIAHDLEDIYVEAEPKAPKTRGRKKGSDA
jgi:hypothetical protein